MVVWLAGWVPGSPGMVFLSPSSSSPSSSDPPLPSSGSRNGCGNSLLALPGLYWPRAVVIKQTRPGRNILPVSPQCCIVHIQGVIWTEREFPINIIFIDVELCSFIKFIEATTICGSNLSVLIFNIWWVQLQIFLLTINSSRNKQSLLNYWFLIFVHSFIH